MRKTKLEAPNILPYDYRRVEAHLTQMAAKGWRLDNINAMGFWHYRRAEPAQVRYEVTYVAKGSNYNPKPTEEEQALEDICAEAGWVSVARTAQVQVFCNEDLNATPLETDDEARIAVLGGILKKFYMGQLMRNGLLFLLLAVINLCTLLGTPTLLARGFAVYVIPMLTVTALGCVISALGCRSWLKAAEAAAGTGEPIPQMGFHKWYLRMSLAGLLGFGVLMLLGAQYTLVLSIVVLTIVLLASIFLTNAAAKALKAPRWLNMVLTVVVATVALNVGTTLIPYDRIYAPQYQAGEMPLMVSDLDTEYRGLSRYAVDSHERTFLLSELHCYEEPVDAEAYGYISYAIWDSPFDWVLELCYKDAFEDFYNRQSRDADGTPLADQAKLWNAEAAWYSDEWDGDYFLVKWENRLVFLSADWYLSEGEIQRAAEILRPHG